MKVLVFDQNTGHIKQAFEFIDERADDLLLNIPEGHLAMEMPEGLDIERHFVDVNDNDRLVQYPVKPGDWAEFDYNLKIWVDPRTDEDKEELLHAARLQASLSKRDFCNRCMEFGILPPDEAAQAARGEIPDSFKSIVDSLPPMQFDQAMIDWPAATRIDRMNPLILYVAQQRNISDEFLDLLFMIPNP